MLSDSSAEDRSVERTSVLWLIKGLGPGGAERLLVSLAEVATHDRFLYRVVYLRPDKNMLVGPLAELGVTTQCIGDGPDGARRWPMRLRSMLRETRVDVVHSHSPLMAAAARLAAITLPPSRRPVLVSTEHNEWPSYRAPTRLANALTAPADRHRWAVSTRVKESMWRHHRHDVEVLVHGLPPSARRSHEGARERLRRELGIAPDAFVVAQVANYRSEKAHPVALEAARLAIKDEPRIVLLLVGQGPLEAEVRAWHSRLGLGDSVRLLGYRDDVADVLAASDLFTLSSDFEGFPISLMEAQAVGLPVVATAVGGIPDAVRDGVEGLLVPTQDPYALSQAWVLLARNRALSVRMGQAGLARSNYYDIRLTGARMEQVYDTLLRR